MPEALANQEEVVRDRVQKAERRAIELFKNFKIKQISTTLGFDLGFQLAFELTWERESTLALEAKEKKTKS